MFTTPRPLRLMLALLMLTTLLLAGAEPAPASARRATGAAAATDRLIVTLAPATSAGVQRAGGAAQVASTLSADAGTALDYVRPFVEGAHIFALDGVRPADEVATIMARLTASPEVLRVEPDLILYPLREPSDPYYQDARNFLWHFKPVSSGNYGANLPPAWDITTGAPGIVTAIIDTGGRLTHEDLAGRTPPGNPGYDLISDSFKANDGNGRDGDPSDPGDYVLSGEGCALSTSTWHGTHVAGTIGARANNGKGVAGVVWDAPILHVRALGKCGGWLSDISDGVRWAAGLSVPGLPLNPNPARVINLSLGGGGTCVGSSFQDAVTAAGAAGSVVVVAAGNQGIDASNFVPANCEGVITVAATGQSGRIASYSNYGSLVEIAAPGGDNAAPAGSNALIFSTIDSGDFGPTGDTYTFYQGTSMATPHVAGIAALMLSANPSLTPAAVLSIMQSTATGFPAGSGCEGNCGAGIINAGAAVEEAARRVRTAAFTSTSTSATEGATVSIPVALSIAGGQAVPVPFTISGTASSGDTDLVAGNLVFPAGTTSANLSVLLTDDALGEENEAVVITIGAGERSGAGAAKTHTITILDNDARPRIALTPATTAFGDQRVGSTSVTRTVTISSTGDLPLTISGRSLSTGFVRAGGNCPSSPPFNLAPGASCTVGLSFKPTLTGAINGALSVSNNAGPVQVVALNGRGVIPALGFGPTSLSFADQIAGTTSATQTVTLTNPGTAPLVVSAIAVSGDYRVGAAPCAASLPTTLAPGASCAVRVDFAPQAGGLREGALTVTSNAVGGPYSIALRGVGLAPKLALDAVSLDFGGQQVNTSSAARTITVRNAGSATLSLTGLDLSGVPFSRVGGSCPSLPAELGPGATCTVQISFAPTLAGEQSGMLSVTSAGLGGATMVAMRGDGTTSAAPSPMLSPAAVSFGTVVQAATPTAQTITLSNEGNATMTLGAVSLDGAGFSLSGGTCATDLILAPDESCTVDVSLTGASAGVYTGTLSIASDAPGEAQVAALEGTVGEAGTFSLANIIVAGTPYTVSLSFDVTREAPLNGAASEGYSVIADREMMNGDLVVADATASFAAGASVRRVTLTFDRLAIYGATHLVVNLDDIAGGATPRATASVAIPAALTRVMLPFIQR